MPDIHVVFHTHWDREWYLPFAVYRRRLVALLDSLLLSLEREPDLRFHLDGQMAIVDDYLELRPEREGALRRAAGHRPGPKGQVPVRRDQSRKAATPEARTARLRPMNSGPAVR